MCKYMKWIVKIVLTVLGLVVLIAVTVFLQRVDPKQKVPNVEALIFADTLAGRQYDLDSIKSIIGSNKGLPEGFEIAAAIAFSAYPELKDVNIDMVLTLDGAPMESSLEIWSLFGLAKNRRYLVLLNDAANSYFDPILLRSLPFDAQVGILAHELGHIAYYHELNMFEFGRWGLNYLRDDEFRATHERTTDLMPVYHGLGSQIYQYAYFVRKDPTCKAFYEEGKDFMDKYYLTDEEILDAMNERNSKNK
jgi:hypothetical protein